jgi:hypothetical protein
VAIHIPSCPIEVYRTVHCPLNEHPKSITYDHHLGPENSPGIHFQYRAAQDHHALRDRALTPFSLPSTAGYNLTTIGVRLQLFSWLALE